MYVMCMCYIGSILKGKTSLLSTDILELIFVIVEGKDPHYNLRPHEQRLIRYAFTQVRIQL